MGRPETALYLSTLSRTWPLLGEWLVSQEHTAGGEPTHDSLCPALGPPLSKPPGCLSPVLGPLLREAWGSAWQWIWSCCSQGQPPRAPRPLRHHARPLTHSSWRPAHPASCAGHGFLLCSLPTSLPAAPATLSSAQVLTGHKSPTSRALCHPQAWVPLARTHPLHLVNSIPPRPHSLPEAIPDYPQLHQAGSPGLPSAKAAWSSAASPHRH